MTLLPASIEAYLLESGFSQTEILILRHLLEGGAMTLREIAGKTGKSTGVLDQAMKKMLKKKIVSKELINDAPKYALVSLDALLAWVREDMQSRHALLERREKDITTFVSSAKDEAGRPDVQHYEGLDGMQKLYTQLLHCAEKEMLHVFPVTTTETDDPLRDFRVQHFRDRRKRGIFARYIVHDVPLGRRFQSRDIFEYRKTLLVSPETHPFAQEKIVAGDCVATVNHEERKGFLIRSKEMAEMERGLFEALWRQGGIPSGAGTLAPVAPEHSEESARRDVETRFFSSMREFFLSRKSLAVFGLCALLSAAVTYGLYVRNVKLNTERVRDQIMAIASTAALQFDAGDLDQLRTEADVAKPAYARVITKLREVRYQNPSIKYAYIMRPTEDPEYFAFVADADSLDLDARVDLNGDGKVNEADWLSPPGELYPVRSPGDSEENARVLLDALEGPAATPDPSTDQWGTFISGLAPIRDSNGRTVAVVGFDRDASDVQRLTAESFQPMLFFVVIFLLFAVIRFSATNKSVVKEYSQLTKTKNFFISLIVALELLILIIWLLYLHTLSVIKSEMGERVKAITATASLQISYKDLIPLKKAADMRLPEYQNVFETLNRIRNQNSEIEWIYILRPTSVEQIWEFVVDANANYYLEPCLAESIPENSVCPPEFVNVWPGYAYSAENYSFQEALQEPTAEKKFDTDQWGTFLSGYSPIYNDRNEAVAILGADILVTDVLSEVHRKFLPVLGIVIVIFALFSIIHIYRVFTERSRSSV